MSWLDSGENSGGIRTSTHDRVTESLSAALKERSHMIAPFRSDGVVQACPDLVERGAWFHASWMINISPLTFISNGASTVLPAPSETKMQKRSTEDEVVTTARKQQLEPNIGR